MVAAKATLARLLNAPVSTATALSPKVAASTPLINNRFNFTSSLQTLKKDFLSQKHLMRVGEV